MKIYGDMLIKILAIVQRECSGRGAVQVRKYIEDVDLTSNFNGGRPGGSLERGALLKVRLEREAPMKI